MDGVVPAEEEDAIPGQAAPRDLLQADLVVRRRRALDDRLRDRSNVLPEKDALVRDHAVVVQASGDVEARLRTSAFGERRSFQSRRYVGRKIQRL